MAPAKLNLIGELMNNSYARARKAFSDRSLQDYQRLAKIQSDLGVRYLTLNLDGTSRIKVKMEEMLAFLPDVIPAIQEVTSVPLSFDNPSIRYHEVALAHYDRTKSGAPILNSVAASRERLEDMIALVAAYDTNVIVMASEHFVAGGSSQCLRAVDELAAARCFVEWLVTKANRRRDQIFIDPGLAPVGADTYGLVNTGLEAMRLIRADPDLVGVHFVVGLSNFAWGAPRGVREQLESAYLTLAMDAGLDYALANPEKAPGPLPPGDPMVARLRAALQQGRVRDGESQEAAKCRQAEAIMALCAKAAPADA